MHQTELVMCVLQRRADLMYPKGYILEPESLSRPIPFHRGQRPAIHVLSCDCSYLIIADEFINPCDTRMGQQRAAANFFVQPFKKLTLPRKTPRQELQRHVPLCFYVPGLPHLSVIALAQDPLEQVAAAADPRARGGRLGPFLLPDGLLLMPAHRHIPVTLVRAS